MSTLLEQAGQAGWQPVPNDDFERMWRSTRPGVPPPQLFVREQLRVLVGREPIGDYDDPDPRWHISVSCADRLPTWAEMVDVAHSLRPGVVFVIGVPPRSWWMNVHPYCLHLWQLHDGNLVREWRSNATGDTPT